MAFIRVWDTTNGKLLRVLVGHDSSVHGVAFSPDGNFLASTGSFDLTARVWNAKTGMPLRVLKKHKGHTSGVYWSPDSATLIVTGGDSAFATIWDPANNRQIRSIEIGMSIEGAALSPDGKLFAFATPNGASIWKTADGSNVGQIKVAGNKAFAVGWSPDSKKLLVGATKTVDVWDVEGNKLVNSLGGTGRAVAWSPDGLMIATSYGVTTQLFDGVTFAPLRNDAVPALALDWNKKSGVLAAVSPQNAYIVDAKDEKKNRSFPVGEGSSMLWSPGRPVVSGIDDTTLKLWDPVSGKLLHTLTGHTDAVLAAAWSRDGKYLATAGKDATTRIWDGKTGALTRTLSAHSKEVKALAWSPDGRLATGSADNKVLIFPADSDKPKALTAHTHPVTTLVWRDANTLLSGSEDGKIHFWNTEAAKPNLTIDVEHDIFAIALSKDGNYLACGSNDDVARIYSMSNGKPILQLDASKGAAIYYNLSWSPDGAYVATTNYWMQLWNAKTAKLLHSYQVAGATHSISWSADGRTTIASCMDRAVRFCETPTGALRGTMIAGGKQIVSISGEGHYRAPADAEGELVYVIQTERSQDTYDLKTFSTKFAWKNNSAAVKGLGN